MARLPGTLRPDVYALRPGRAEDAQAIKACIDASYGHYVEYDRRVEDGLPRVYMRKPL